MLAPHGFLFFQVFFVSHCHAGNADFLRQNRLNALGKRQLYRAAYLAAIDLSSHDRTETADVIKIGAHPAGDFLGIGLSLRQLLGSGFSSYAL